MVNDKVRHMPFNWKIISQYIPVCNKLKFTNFFDVSFVISPLTFLSPLLSLVNRVIIFTDIFYLDHVWSEGQLLNACSCDQMNMVNWDLNTMFILRILTNFNFGHLGSHHLWDLEPWDDPKMCWRRTELMPNKICEIDD